MLTYITPAQFEQIRKYLPVVKSTRPKLYSDYTLLNAILHLLKTGSQWRNLSNEFPPWQSAYWFWRKLQSWRTLDLILSKTYIQLHIRDTTIRNSHILITDSASIDATEYLRTNCKGYDGNKLKLGLKRFVLCDTNGFVFDVFCSKANTGEKTALKHYLLTHLSTKWNTTTLIADKGFESQGLELELFHKLRLCYCPMKRKKKYKSTKYTEPLIAEEEVRRQDRNNWIKKLRYVVEQVFSWFNKYRRLIRCFERSQTAHANFCKLASIHLMLRRF